MLLEDLACKELDLRIETSRLKGPTGDVERSKHVLLEEHMTPSPVPQPEVAARKLLGGVPR